VGVEDPVLVVDRFRHGDCCVASSCSHKARSCVPARCCSISATTSLCESVLLALATARRVASTAQSSAHQAPRARWNRRGFFCRGIVQASSSRNLLSLNRPRSRPVGHFQLPSLRHGSLWWTERCRRYVDRFQHRGKHRPRLPPEESLRRRRPVRTCEEKVRNRRQTCPLSEMVKSEASKNRVLEGNISYPEFGLDAPRSRSISSNITAHFPAPPGVV